MICHEFWYLCDGEDVTFFVKKCYICLLFSWIKDLREMFLHFPIFALCHVLRLL